MSDDYVTAKADDYGHFSCDVTADKMMLYKALLEEQYSTGCMLRRNEYMVDCSSTLIACFDGRPGGTMNTIVYAKREGLAVRMLDVSELQAETTI